MAGIGRLLTIFGIAPLARILRALIDRTPVIVVCRNEQAADLIAGDLVDIMNLQRQELVYQTDFISNREIEALFDDECANYDSKRIIVRAPSHTLSRLFPVDQEEGNEDQITTFKGWVLGCSWAVEAIQKRISRYAQNYLIIDLPEFSHENAHSITFYPLKTSSNLSLERDILQKAVKDTDVAIERMRRILEKKIASSSRLDPAVVNAVMNFESEKNLIQSTMVREQISDLIQAARRALSLLSRVSMLKNIGVDNLVLSDKTLEKSIDYKGLPLSRIIELIETEWNENFSELIENKQSTKMGDIVEGMW